MFESVFDVFFILCGTICELSLFTLVDKVTQQLITKACVTKDEKQAIWLLQCAALFFLSFVINFHHTPYFLFAMACFALIYTIFLQKLSIRNYIGTLRTTWQDSIDFNSSLGPSQDQHDITLANHGGLPSGPQSLVNPRSILPLPSAPGFPQNYLHPDAAVPSSVPVAPTPVVKNTLTGTSAEPFRHHGNMSMASSGMSGVGQSASPMKADARANRSYNSFRIIPGLLNHMPDFKSWFNRAWRRDYTLPPGLFNYNHENLCFINCVLQTISRSPQLMEGLRMVAALSHIQQLPLTELTFLQEAMNVFSRLTLPDERNSEGQYLFNCQLVDTSALRKAIHHLRKDKLNEEHLVVDPSSGIAQQQQDASEFLLWLLDTLLEAVTLPPVTGQISIYTRPAIHQTIPTAINSAQASLHRLKASLGYPSTDLITIHKQRCHAELANAHGQNNASYTNLVTMLSSLDWLLYKENHNSIVDDLFSGQQVSASCCLGCYHISVSTDVFRILTLPIPSGCDCVAIADCFWQLTKVENFTPQNRPKLESCSCALQNNFPGNAYHHLFRNSSNFQTSTPNGPRLRRTDNVPYSPAMPGVSPIAGASLVPPLTPMLLDPLQLQVPIAGCQRQTSLQRLPECLVVQLLRFSFDGVQSTKVHTRVKVSLEQIDLSRLIIVRNTQLEPMFYSLYGICMHSNSPSTQSGHYTAYALANDGHWYFFNDLIVSRVEIEHELSKKDVQENVYILYYHRIANTVRS